MPQVPTPQVPMPQAVSGDKCSQMHSFAGYYAGSQGLSIKFSLVLLFQFFLP